MAHGQPGPGTVGAGFVCAGALRFLVKPDAINLWQVTRVGRAFQLRHRSGRPLFLASFVEHRHRGEHHCVRGVCSGPWRGGLIRWLDPVAQMDDCHGTGTVCDHRGGVRCDLEVHDGSLRRPHHQGIG